MADQVDSRLGEGVLAAPEAVNGRRFGASPGEPTFAVTGPRVRARQSDRARDTDHARTSVVLRRETVYRRALATADLISAAAGVAAAIALAHESVSILTLVAPVAVVPIAKLMSLYDRDQNVLRKGTLDEAPALFRLATLFALLIWLADGLIGAGALRSPEILMLLGLLIGMLIVTRSAARRAVTSAIPIERCLLLGDPTAGEAIARKLEATNSVKAIVVGFLPLEAGGGYEPTPIASRDMLSAAIDSTRAHRVIVAPGNADPATVLNAIRHANSLGVKVSVIPRLFEVVGSAVAIDEIEGLTLFGIRRDGLTRSSRVIKRGMDLAGAALGLLGLSPLLLAISVAIKVSSPGPVLFRQRRIGYGGKEIEVVKFRTMVDGADLMKAGLTELNEAGAGFFKIAHDPRITTVGRVLRRSCLDELPQLLNVLQGQMSLVGPRPLVPEEDSLVGGWDRDRLRLTPGITGLWQVFGSSRIPMAEMVKIDYMYAANWSLWLDVKILLRTVQYVTRRNGL